MPKVLQLEMVIASLLLLIIVLVIVKKDKISVRYSMVWLLSGGLMLFFALFPNLLSELATYLGFETVSNMIFLFMLAILFLISISLTIIVTNQKEQMRLLIQELSALKSKGGK